MFFCLRKEEVINKMAEHVCLAGPEKTSDTAAWRIFFFFGKPPPASGAWLRLIAAPRLAPATPASWPGFKVGSLGGSRWNIGPESMSPREKPPRNLAKIKGLFKSAHLLRAPKSAESLRAQICGFLSGCFGVPSDFFWGLRQNDPWREATAKGPCVTQASHLIRNPSWKAPKKPLDSPNGRYNMPVLLARNPILRPMEATADNWPLAPI